MKYQVVREGDISTLTQLVNVFLADGWEPLGSPFVFNGQVCQAMIKRSQRHHE